MRLGDRAVLDDALRPARASAYPPGEFVGQESFVRAQEVLALASAAGIGEGVSVLDLCCGVAGPGRFLTAELGCRYLGVDADRDAVDLARRSAAGLSCRFEVARVPPLPSGSFDVVLLLETMLAFRDKARLFQAVAEALPPGGRFAFTVEEGTPLTDAERTVMPEPDTVWLTPLPELVDLLGRAGLQVRLLEDHSASHLATVDALIDAFAADGLAIAERVGRDRLDSLLAAHRLWSGWLREGRVRKLALVAERTPSAADASGRRLQQHAAVGRAYLH